MDLVKNRNKKMAVTLRKAFRLFILLTVALLAAPRMWSLYTLGLALAAGFIMIITGNKEYRKCKQNLKFILPPVIYFTLVLTSSLLQKWDGSLVEIRLMFLLVPLLTCPAMSSDQTLAKWTIRIYLWSLSAILIFLIVRSVLVYFGLWVPVKPIIYHFTSRETIFFSENFSVMEHPTYLAMKVSFAMLIVLLINDQFMKSVFRILFFILFSVSLFLLGSKGGLMAWIVIVHFAAWKVVARLPYRFLLFGLMLTTLYLTVAWWITKVDRIDFFITTRMEAVRNSDIPWQEIDQRTREWFAAASLVGQRPLFGHGLARLQERLDEEYIKNGWYEEAELHLNAHNQFLENQAVFGIAGSMVLIWLLFTPLLFRKKSVYPEVAVALTLLMTFFLTFESMFNRQWGIMFFMLFYCILLFSPNNGDNAEPSAQLLFPG
jgi:hypothetical protein